jgi:hypothetical protein
MEDSKAPVSEHGGETSKAAVLEVAASSGSRRAASRGLAVLDLILRFVAVIATVGSAIAMGTTNQTLPFFTQFLRFKAQYSDLPTLTYVHRSFNRSTNLMIVFAWSTQYVHTLFHLHCQVLRGGEFDRCRVPGPVHTSVHRAHHGEQGEVQ